MKISLNWLKEFIPFRWSPEELAQRLTMIGLEVEQIEKVKDDVCLHIGITPNRGDALSMMGIAREAAALQGKSLAPGKSPALKMKAPPKGNRPIRDFLSVRVEDAKGCPRYMARVIHGLTIGPSPAWMQRRLEAVGLRPINNVVDCTNYVMWELGHPLHPFDHRSLTGLQIVVRCEKEPMFFVTLDGASRACVPGDLFICDENNPVALAGIMGGANSEVRADTTTIVLEAAFFDPARIHRTRKRLKMQSESAYRFERGVDPGGVGAALHRVTELILQTAGGQATQDWIDIYPKKIKPRTLDLPLSEVTRLLGLKITAAGTQKILQPLGMKVTGKGKSVKVLVPTFRCDVKEPIDLIEEICRLKGYDRIEATLPKIRMQLPHQPAGRCAEAAAAAVLQAQGYQEICPLSFASSKKAAALGLKTPVVRLANPLSEDHDILRPSLLPGLLEAGAFNLNRQRSDVKLFLIGKVFEQSKSVQESKRLGIFAAGQEWENQWGLPKKPSDFFSLKGILKLLSQSLFLDDFSFPPSELPSWVVPSQGAAIFWKGKKIGWCGKLSPNLLKGYEIEQEVWALEMEWEGVGAKAGAKIRFKKPSKFPFVERDLALVVAQDLPAQAIEEAIWAEKSPWIQSVHLFDLFKGESLPAGHKSVAFTIRYACPQKTLTHEEVHTLHERLTARLTADLPAQLRK